MTETEKNLKLKRRTAKARFTRYGNNLDTLIESEEAVQEIQEAYEKYAESFAEVEQAHESYTELLDDEKFDEEENWIDSIQATFTKLTLVYRKYKLQQNSTSATATPSDNGGGATQFKLERLKLPKFKGDIRDYHVFKADFRHMVRNCTSRDSIALLRSCLEGKPGEMIRGIGDYKEAWEFLDSIYGDRRFIADAILNDVNSFRQLKDGEDARFCELVHLIRHSYNTLKEVGRPEDMDNSQMLALIERKLNTDDRKVWFRYLETTKTEASLSILLDWMNTEMRSRMRAIAPVRCTSSSNSSKPRASIHHVKSPQQPEYTFYRCWLCESNTHWIDQCQKLISMTQPERLKFMKEHHACFSCLKRAGRDHRMTNCKKKKQCSEMSGGNQCRYFHHPLLHLDVEQLPPSNAKTHVAFVTEKEALLPILTAKLIGQKGSQNGNVLLDTGSQISIIRQSVANELNLTGHKISVSITKVGGEEEQVQTRLYKVPVKPMNSNQKYVISAIGLPCISEDVADVSITEEAKQLKIDQKELHRSSGPIDLLVGMDHMTMHVGETRQAANCAARKSPLGWVIFGGSASNCQPKTTVLHAKVTTIELSDFWTTESMGVRSPSCECDTGKMSPIEKTEYDVIKNSCTKTGNQWTVAYPWKKDPDLLPDNQSQVKHMLIATERRLERNPEHAAAYQQQMQEMVDMGFAKKLTQAEIDSYEGPVHYIGHHAILRPEKKSTPVRIVFNSSSVFHGHSLNDYWMKGPNLLQNLFGVLLRIREGRIGICGDISKMYHRVRIPEADQHTHRYLWRDLEIKREPDVYVKTVVTFGDKPAPAMAQIALQSTAEEGEQKFPEAARVIKENSYMDDICFSVDTKQEAKKLTREIDDILAAGGFKVKGWSSNEDIGNRKAGEKEGTKVLEDISEEKVLGVVWEQKTDTFSYNVKTEKVQDSKTVSGEELTKRKILSLIAKIFDPIGFTAAFLVKAKIGMQRLWEAAVDWDDELPEETVEEWKKLFQEMTELNEVRFPRSLVPPQPAGNPMICVFCDASEAAFGAVIYLRWQLEASDEFDVRFLAAKSRVAPLKKLTLPRMELQAAVLATRLYASVKEEMNMQVDSVVFFTDSMIVLGWIRSQARTFKPFVSARAGEIQTNSDPSWWRHVSGDINPADDISRGIAPEKLMERWRNGPEFLYNPEESWPCEEPSADHSKDDPEKRKVQVNVAEVNPEIIDCEKFSKWRRLIRVTAYVLRFIKNLKAKCSSSKMPASEQLSPAELNEAEYYWVKKAQQPLHNRMKKGEFKTLSPYMQDGLIRVGGRIGEGLISYEQRHPVLLPRSHHISKLIVGYVHEQGHEGVASTAAKVRQRYWILGVHRLAKSVKHKCVVCRKKEHKVEFQFMAELPYLRMAPFTPPFYYTSVDYFGPYHVRIGRNKTVKHYGVIFTCLNTRAVHLDLAVDCSTMEFLQVLRRFMAIRGQPAVIVSDNGTQFVGAEKELRAMIEGWSKDELRDFCAERGTQWKFVTPSAPHQNGCAESLVKSCKIALRKAVGDQVLTPFELLTCLTDVANLVNQRPIGRVPNDPDDGRYLSPNDILLGRASNTTPQGPFRSTRNPRHRVEFVQKIVDSFWKCWIRDVFPLLVPRRKWNVERRNVRVDDVVIIADHNVVRGKWTTGRIINVYPGVDGKIRNVKVKTVDSELCRPINKIVVIYPAEGYENDD